MPPPHLASIATSLLTEQVVSTQWISRAGQGWGQLPPSTLYLKFTGLEVSWKALALWGTRQGQWWHRTLPRHLPVLPEASGEEQMAPKVEPFLCMAPSNLCHSHDTF